MDELVGDLTWFKHIIYFGIGWLFGGAIFGITLFRKALTQNTFSQISWSFVLLLLIIGGCQFVVNVFSSDFESSFFNLIVILFGLTLSLLVQKYLSIPSILGSSEDIRQKSE